LSLYNPPEISYRALELSPDISIGGRNHETMNDQQSTYDHQFEYESHRARAGARIHYFQYIDRDNLQLSFSSAPRLSLDYDRATNEAVTEHYNATEQQMVISDYAWQSETKWNSELRLYVSQIARWYPTRRTGGFAALDFRGNIAWQYFNEQSPLDVRTYNAQYGDSIVVAYQKSEDVTHSYTAAAHLYLGGGAGRVDDVTYAAVALNIYEELGGSSLLNRTPETIDIQDLAKLLNQRKERRIFDTRTARIENVVAICAFLQQRELIADQTGRAAMLVNDMYAYSFNQQRESGVRFEAGPAGGVSYERWQGLSTEWEGRTIEDDEIMDNPRDIQEGPLRDSMPSDADERDWSRTGLTGYGLVEISLTYRKPRGRWWQFGLSPAARLGVCYAENAMSNADEYALVDTGAQTFYFTAHRLEGRVDCFVSTRTTITLEVDGTWYGAFTLDEDSVKGDAVCAHTRMGLDYYLSPRLKLGLGANLAFDKSWGDTFTVPVGNATRDRVWHHRFSGTGGSQMTVEYFFGADLSLDIF